ncbi:hypothetical protein HYH03_008023 [Edaphochlamys debaryana]|uniref:Uncharacterized protein n=1 Tax=Edaphochlamys debaryana TaxID=47281 RepID=A0A835YA69_9CHLO|nr:hypothetical protein HYH03_008023 [Edaphochlamys debaryana]|eukprot:KAG2493804.1 hypothetical protein HYH03_008023 [Edaphochlamys debaryana]
MPGAASPSRRQPRAPVASASRDGLANGAGASASPTGRSPSGPCRASGDPSSASATAGRQATGAAPGTANRGGQTSSTYYSHSTAPSAVRSRTAAPGPAQAAASAAGTPGRAGASYGTAGTALPTGSGRGDGRDGLRPLMPQPSGDARASWGEASQGSYDSDFDPDPPQPRSRLAVPRLEAGPPPGRAAAILAGVPTRVTADPADPGSEQDPPTEQDQLCDLAAAGIIVAAQQGSPRGVVDASMRGITRLPPALLRFFRAEGAIVCELQLGGNRLTAVPPLEALPRLTRLDLSSNMLAAVPPSLGLLTLLRALDLSRNGALRELPEGVCGLTALTSLDLSHNALESLPLGLGRLSRLLELRLDGNQLSYLPPALAGLPCLTALHASYNRLTALPSELGAATCLTGIYVSHNRLTAIPPDIGQLRHRLSELQLHNNHLSVLPRELGLLASLTRLTTSANPLVHPPPHVARRGVAAVREFLLGGWTGAASAPTPAQSAPEGASSENGAWDEDEGEEEEGEEEGTADGSPGPSAVEEAADGAPSADRTGTGKKRRPRPRVPAAAPGPPAPPPVLGLACRACVDKDDRIEEQTQLLREARDRLTRAEASLDRAREGLRRQAADLADQATRRVGLEGELAFLRRQLEAAALLPGYRGPRAEDIAGGVGAGGGRAGGGGGGGGGGGRPGPGGMQGEVDAALRAEMAAVRRGAEAAEAAAAESRREAALLRRALADREAEAAMLRERSAEVEEGAARERERCAAATAAATAAEARAAALEPLIPALEAARRDLQAAKADADRAWKATHTAREGHQVSEAAADMAVGRLAAAEATAARLTEQVLAERRAGAAAVAAVESSGDVDNLQVAIQAAGCTPDAEALEIAALAGALESCQLIAGMLELDARRLGTSLSYAAKGAHRAVCQWCLANGAKRSWRAVAAAYRGGHPELAELLQPAGKPNTHDVAPLLEGAAEGCSLAVLQTVWGTVGEQLTAAEDDETRSKPLTAAVGSPTPDWEAKAEFLLAQGLPFYHTSANAAVCLPPDTALQRLEWLKARGCAPASLSCDVAVWTASPAVVSWLLDGEAFAYDLWAQYHHGDVPPLDVAQLVIKAEMVEPAQMTGVALKAGAKGLPLLRWLVDTYGEEALDVGLESLDEVSEWGFGTAAEEGCAGAMEVFRRHGLEFKDWQWEKAAASGSEEALEFLARIECPRPAYGWAFNFAALHGDARTLRVLRRLGVPWGAPSCAAHIGADGTFARAYRSGVDMDTLRWMVAEGCPVDWAAVGKADSERGSPVARRRPEEAAELQAWLAEQRGAYVGGAGEAGDAGEGRTPARGLGRGLCAWPQRSAL